MLNKITTTLASAQLLAIYPLIVAASSFGRCSNQNSVEFVQCTADQKLPINVGYESLNSHIASNHISPSAAPSNCVPPQSVYPAGNQLKFYAGLNLRGVTTDVWVDSVYTAVYFCSLSVNGDSANKWTCKCN